MEKFKYRYIHSKTRYVDMAGVISETKATFKKGEHLLVSFCVYFHSYCYFLEYSRIIFGHSRCVGFYGVSTGKQLPAFWSSVMP